MRTCRRCTKILHDLAQLDQFHLCKKCSDLIHDDPRVSQAREVMNMAIDLAIREASYVPRRAS